MIIEGQIDVNAPVQKVWDFLMDIQELSSCIPGLEEINQLDEETFEGVIGAKVGPMSGKFRFSAGITESTPPTRMKVRVEGKDDLTKSTINATVTLGLAEAGGGSQIHHRFDADIQGRIAIVGDMILRGVAGVMLKEFAKRLRNRLETDFPGETF